MAYEHQPGKGSIFNNSYKEHDKQPDMKGTMKTPDGQEWEISGWWSESRNGQYLSISIQEPYDPSKRRGAPANPHPASSPARGGPSGGGYGGQGRGGSGAPPVASRDAFEEQRRRMQQMGREAAASRPPMDDFADDDIPF